MINLQNKRFSRLLVIKLAGKSNNGGLLWLCRCVCGGERVYTSSGLVAGRTKTCGCGRKKHGKSRTGEHRKWSDMRQRCNNTRHKSYKDYGGRGIKICKRWQVFKNFYQDMGVCPVGMTLDRVKNNGNYNKRNCRWATQKQQAVNKRNTVIISFEGKNKTVGQWGELLGINPDTLYSRLFTSKWPINRALTEKINYGKQKQKIT